MSNTNTTSYTVTSQTRVSQEELDRRQILDNNSNNWPPLPSFCPCGPCFVQDFDIDIAIEFRQTVQRGYYLYMAHVIVLLFNILGTLAYFIAAKNRDDKPGIVFAVSILNFILFVPLAYIFWFRALYNAFKNNSSFSFFVYFINTFIQIIVLLIQSIGINVLGSCGWVNSMGIIGHNVGVGIFMFIIAASFTALAVVNIILLRRVHSIYRSTGASFEKAQEEFSTGVVTNDTVRGAAAGAGESATHNAFSGGYQRY